MKHVDVTSRRTQLALRFFTYGVMTVATVILTILAIFYAMGYRFDQNHLSFAQGGLVQFQSVPEGVPVTIDGKLRDLKTPTRANLAAGTHTIKMQLNGYGAWQKTVTLAAGQLLWLNYVRLIPDNLTTTTVSTHAALATTLPSPDKKWLVLQEKLDSPSLILVDINDEKKPLSTQLALPDAVLTKKDGKMGQLHLVEWDTSSRYLLLEHVNGDIREFIRLDRTRPGEATNLSQVFRLNITEVHFAGTNANVVYAKTDAVLRRLDISGTSASAALVTGLSHFAVYANDVVSFVAVRESIPGNPATKQQVIGLYDHDKETIAQTFPPEAQITIAYAEYFRHGYLAYSTGDGVVRVLRDVTSGANAEFATFTLPGKPVAWLTFSNNGRMLAAGNGNSLANYDLELAEASNSTLQTAEPVTRPLRWLDNYHLYADAGGKLRMFEFDGQNARDILPVAPGYHAQLSANGGYMFSIGKDAGGVNFVLQSSKLTTN